MKKAGVKKFTRDLFNGFLADNENSGRIRDQMTETNFNRSFIACIALALLEISNLIFDAILKPYEGATAFVFMVLASVCLTIALLFLAFMIKVKRSPQTKNKTKDALNYLFWLLCVSIGIIFVYNDITASGGKFNVVFIPLTVAIVPLYPFKKIVLLMGLYTASIVSIVVLIGDSANNSYIHYAAVLPVIFIMIGQVIYYSQVKTYSFQFELDSKNKQLDMLVNQLDILAKTDPVTALPNMRALDMYIKMIWDHCRIHGITMLLMIIDIDDFKEFNDRNGRAEGDACITKISEEIRKSVSSLTDYIGRYGGDELMVVSDHINGESAQLLCDKLLQCVEDLHIPAGETSASAFVTVSIGAVIKLPGSVNEIEQMKSDADAAVALAKEKGKNCAIVTVK